MLTPHTSRMLTLTACPGLPSSPPIAAGSAEDGGGGGDGEPDLAAANVSAEARTLKRTFALLRAST